MANVTWTPIIIIFNVASWFITCLNWHVPRVIKGRSHIKSDHEEDIIQPDDIKLPEEPYDM